MLTGRVRTLDAFVSKGSGKFSGIVERIERLRTALRLNKSNFARAIGLSPQTYNNFTGAQASKPSVELLHGLVTRCGANPMWILTGAGSMFMERADAASQGNSPRIGAGPLAVLERADPMDADLARQLESVQPLIERIEAALARVRDGHESLLQRVADVFRQYLRQNPTEAVAELRAFLERIERTMPVN